MTSIRKLAVIMFADIVGYTAMMQEDEVQAKNWRDRHRTIIEEQVNVHAGQVVQYYGDGALITFPSAKEAILSALAIQKNLLQTPEVPVRIGIHMGEIVQDEGGIFGDSVNIASRIESMAISGSVLFSDKIYREIANHPDIGSKTLGKFQLKNVKRPVKIYALCNDDIRIPLVSNLNFAKGESITQSIAILPFNEWRPFMIDNFKFGLSDNQISRRPEDWYALASDSKMKNIVILNRFLTSTIEVPIKNAMREIDNVTMLTSSYLMHHQ